MNHLYTLKRKVALLLLPVILLILLLSVPLEASNVELQMLEEEATRLITEKEAFRTNPGSFSSEALQALRERKVQLEARISESRTIGLISLEDEAHLRGRFILWSRTLTDLTESEKVYPSLQGRFDALRAATRDAYFRSGLLEKLRSILERYNLLRGDINPAYYRRDISEQQRDYLLDRVEQDRRHVEEEIANMEAQTSPKSSVAPKPSVSEKPSKEEFLDLSGTWQEIKGNKVTRKWEIKADKTGKITLTTVTHLSRRVIEYSGSIKGDIITARCVIKDPDIINPKIPKKVRETVVKKYDYVWNVNLKVSKERTKLEGIETYFSITWSTDTLKVRSLSPVEEKLILKKKAGCSDFLSRLLGAIKTFNGALEKRNRPLMEKAREKVKDIQLSLKSLKPIPKDCKKLPQFIPKVLKTMDAYIKPLKAAPGGKGPPGEGMLPPDTAVVRGPDAPPESPLDEIGRLTDDLVSNWESSSGQQASTAVRDEAHRIAETLIRHIYDRYVEGWRGGFDRNWVVGIREISEDWDIDWLSTRLQGYSGKCYEWANTLHAEYNNLGRLQYFRGAHIWQPGHPSTGVGTHHAFAIYRNGGSYGEGIVIDPWRNDGRPFWGPVTGDSYNWINYPRRR